MPFLPASCLRESFPRVLLENILFMQQTPPERRTVKEHAKDLFSSVLLGAISENRRVAQRLLLGQGCLGDNGKRLVKSFGPTSGDGPMNAGAARGALLRIV